MIYKSNSNNGMSVAVGNKEAILQRNQANSKKELKALFIYPFYTHEKGFTVKSEAFIGSWFQLQQKCEAYVKTYSKRPEYYKQEKVIIYDFT